jgi:hypothetical protein
MKIRYYLFVLILEVFSCQTKKSPSLKNHNQISNWLITNEDSLEKEFSRFIKKENVKSEIGNNTISKGWFFYDSTILGILTKKINILDSNILFSYEYHPQNTKKFAIRISSDRKKSTVKNIDSLFNDIDSLNNFEIIKYNAPDVEMSKYINEDELGRQIIIDPKQLNFKLTKDNSKYILTCFIKKEIPISVKENLIYSILGEEIILKQIDNIRFLDERKYDTSLISIETLRKNFKIYN